MSASKFKNHPTKNNLPTNAKTTIIALLNKIWLQLLILH